jgi:hypothetical protein
MTAVSQLTYTYVYIHMYQHLLYFQLLIVKYFCLPSFSSPCPWGIHFVHLRQLVYMTACGLDLSGCHQKSRNQNGNCCSEIVWKFSSRDYYRVRYVGDGCCPSGCWFMVLLDNILIVVSSTYLLMLHSLKVIWENPQWIEIAFMKNSSTHWYQRMLAIIRCRRFCLLVCHSKSTKIRIYKAKSLPLVLRGCWTWSFTFWEEYRLV